MVWIQFIYLSKKIAFLLQISNIFLNETINIVWHFSVNLIFTAAITNWSNTNYFILLCQWATAILEAKCAVRTFTVSWWLSANMTLVVKHTSVFNWTFYKKKQNIILLFVCFISLILFLPSTPTTSWTAQRKRSTGKEISLLSEPQPLTIAFPVAFSLFSGRPIEYTSLLNLNGGETLKTAISLCAFL